jgi:hypothetical protein
MWKPSTGRLRCPFWKKFIIGLPAAYVHDPPATKTAREAAELASLIQLSVHVLTAVIPW